MMPIKPFQTTSGVLFSFEKDRYTPVYLSSDINSVSEDILSQQRLEGEFYIGAMFEWDNICYEITTINGYRYSSLTPDVPEQYHGKVNNHSVILRFIVVEVSRQKYTAWLNEY